MTLDRTLREDYIDGLREEYVSGDLSIDEFEAAVWYVLTTDEEPKPARDHLVAEFGVNRFALLPTFGAQRIPI
jgi:hypothetical protein